ncbi:MAG: FAD:protein FMN transferase [Synergistaceae bacterium]|nr:FAD:protein FMN transferase [Synergistaceae bacterium]
MKRKIFFTFSLLLILILCFKTSEAKLNSKDGFVMDTFIRISVYSDNENILDDCYGLLTKFDKLFSMYDEKSEIAKINSLAGEKVFRASPEVAELINDSIKVYEITNGIFNPLIGAVTKLWKINTADNKIPTPESLDEAVKLSDIKNLEIHENNIFLKHKGCVLDLSGIAKGYASKKISDFLKSSGVKSALIDLGGNVQTVGKKVDGSNWNIGIRDPSTPYEIAAVVSVNDTAVITSGGYERYKIVNGKKYFHFFDAKTGESITNDLLSVSVVTPDGSLADGLATGFMAAGFERSLEILKNIPESVGVIFIRQNVEGNIEIFATKNLEKSIVKSKYKVTYLHSLI